MEKDAQRKEILPPTCGEQIWILMPNKMSNALLKAEQAQMNHQNSSPSSLLSEELASQF